MKTLSTLFAIITMLISIDSFTQKTWDGSSSTTWSNSNNWTPAGVPTASDNVIIPSGPANQPLLSGTTGVCNNLTINSGATLTISGTTTANALLTASGTATMNGTLSIGGSVSKTGTLSVLNITWASTSSMSGFLNGRIDVTGNWEFSTGSAVSMGLCIVSFIGSSHSNIISKSGSSSFTGLTNNKNSGYDLYISATSTSTLNITGALTLNTGTKLYGEANITTVLGSGLINSGNFYFNAGIVSMEKTSGTQLIQINSGDYFNSLKINGGSTVTLNNNVYILDNLTIQLGTFDPLNYTVNVGGDWINTAGPDYFIEGTGKVVFLVIVTNKGTTAFDNNCNYSENFNILELYNEGGYLVINNAAAVINCNQYNYTAGGINVKAGTFTALDLADIGIYGYWGLQTGGTINLTNTGSYVDLCGNLVISGGNFNVYGGLDNSYWPYNNNAYINMSGGILDFVDNGINVQASTLTLTTNITGGTIRTSGGFTNTRSDFTPAGGTIELYGSADANLSIGTGVLKGLKINKGTTNTVTLTTNGSVYGVLTVESGILRSTNKTLATGDHININNGGTLWIENGGGMMVMSGKALTVNEGGTLKVIGLSGNKSVITKNGTTAAHEIQVNGNISARYAIFEYNSGVNIWSTAIVDPANSFDQCTFQNGLDRFLYVGNSQEITIRDANFPTAPLYNNIWKNNDAGRVTFRDATGAYTGATYENDPYNRVDWIASQPGLWTGAVSSNWFTAGNWDDLNVPTSSTNVTIPTGVPNMPILSTGIPYCNNLTLTGSLTIRAVTLPVSGNMTINGNLIMNNGSGVLNVQGNVIWNSISTASITASATINVYGNWTFNLGANAQLGNGTVYFKGSTNKTITCLSAACSFWNLTTNKTGLAITELSDLSTQPLTINGSFTVLSNSKFIMTGSQTIHVKGNITSSGILQCSWGNVELGGASQVITPNTSDYFNTLLLKQTGTVTINTTYSNILDLKGGILFYSGIFDAGSNIIKVGSDWYDLSGADAFTEGSSRVIFNGPIPQSIYSDESFNILEVDKPAGMLIVNGKDVTCATYDWTSGTISISNGGVFTTNDLADDGIFGGYNVQSDGIINLHQDNSQRVDLNGNIEIESGGIINVYGGNASSQWTNGGNATVYMTDGTFDFKDRGININNMGSNTLTIDITGGTLRTASLFFNNRPGFNPAGGTVELYGPNDVNLEMYAGSLKNLKINKATTKGTLSNSVNLLTNITLNGNLTVESGTLNAVNKIITVAGNIDLNNGGVFSLGAGSQLLMASEKIMNVNSGGTLKTIGTSSNNATISHSAGFYYIWANTGSYVSARHTEFKYLNNIIFGTGTTIDPLNPFDSCTFTNASNVFLTINNDQILKIRGAHFQSTSPPTNNVSKTNNAGRITFKDATGAYAGPAYEYDPNNRIDWSATQPGLWTGDVSTDWHTAGNWDDLKVPITTTNVTIPTGVTNMPVIGSASAYCNNLTLNGTLTIHDRTINVGGNVNIYGTLAMSHYLGALSVQGNITWHSGSTANISANAYIIINGSWSFNEGSNVQMNNGSVSFRGTSYQTIVVFSQTSSFNDLYIENTGTGNVTFSELSAAPLRTKGFYVSMGAHFISSATPNIIVKGNFYSFDATEINTSAVVFEGTDQLIIPHPAAYFNNVIFNQTGTITINQTNTNVLRVKGDLTINSGIFSPGNSIIEVGNNWNNTAGTVAFVEGTSRVRFNSPNIGDYDGTSTAEDFYILEVDKPNGHFYTLINADITCQVYDWTNGGIFISSSFGDFYAADLADDGIYGDNVIWNNTVELHQDASQSVDLHGSLTVNGGEFKVYGGSNQSYWGYYDNATLNMSNGILDFVDQAIDIQNISPYSFTSTITGGTIRTRNGFFAQSPGFNPTGGTVEIYGNLNNSIATEFGGAFYNVTINNTGIMTRTTVLPTLVKNNFTIVEGMAEVPFGWTLECRGNITVEDGGLLAVTSGTVKMGNLSSININSGGALYSEGYEGAPSNFTSNYPSAYYAFNINSGAFMTVYHSIFENMSEQGLYIAPGANINSWKVFESCEFRKGKSGANALLTIDNSQDLSIENAIFPTNTWGGQFNVRKSVDAGTVNFINATGAFAGESFDDDIYNRINWSTVTTKTLNLKLFLEGLYAGGGLMNKAQDENGDHFSGYTAEQVTVELHNAENYGYIEYTVNNVNLTTAGNIAINTIPNSYNGDYFITIKGRNTIETTTASPVTFTNLTTINYDFTTAASKAYGDNMKLMGSVYAIWGGDVNQDGIVDSGDMNPIENASVALTIGYIPEDVNGDGIADSGDMNIVENNSIALISVITP